MLKSTYQITMRTMCFCYMSHPFPVHLIVLFTKSFHFLSISLIQHDSCLLCSNLVLKYWCKQKMFFSYPVLEICPVLLYTCSALSITSSNATDVWGRSPCHTPSLWVPWVHQSAALSGRLFAAHCTVSACLHRLVASRLGPLACQWSPERRIKNVKYFRVSF